MAGLRILLVLNGKCNGLAWSIISSFHAVLHGGLCESEVLMQSKQFVRASEQLQQQRQDSAVQSMAAFPITSTEAYEHLPVLAHDAFDAADLPVRLSWMPCK